MLCSFAPSSDKMESFLLLSKEDFTIAFSFSFWFLIYTAKLPTAARHPKAILLLLCKKTVTNFLEHLYSQFFQKALFMISLLVLTARESHQISREASLTADLPSAVALQWQLLHVSMSHQWECVHLPSTHTQTNSPADLQHPINNYMAEQAQKQSTCITCPYF